MSPGDLAVYEKLPRIKAARFLFVNLGKAEPDKMGRPQSLAQMITHQKLWGWMATGPVRLPTADLTPIADYGVRVRSCADEGRGAYLWLEDDPAAPAGAKQFGNPRWRHTVWETDLWTMVDDDLVDIVQKRLAELALARAA